MAKPFDLAVGEWWRVPDGTNSQLADVYPSTFAGGSSNPPVAIIANWGSGCLDYSRRDFLIWGGGHNAYAGNEVYAFDIEAFEWRRKSYWSTATQDAESNSDGSANTGHTYDTLDYDAQRDVMHVAPGRGLWGTGAVVGGGSWQFDLTNETPDDAAPSAWTQLDGSPDIDPDTADPRPLSYYDPVDHKIYVWHRRGMARMDPDATAGSQWEVLTTFDPSPDYPFNEVMVRIPSRGSDPVRALVIGGDGSVRSCTLRNMDDYSNVGSLNDMGATGNTAIEAAIAPGCDYDSNGDQVVAWAGLLTGGTDRRDYYTLDLDTLAWTRNAGSGDVPPTPQTDGTYGRFRSLADCGSQYAGLFILVNATNDDVFFFRASAAPGISGSMAVPLGSFTSTISGSPAIVGSMAANMSAFTSDMSGTTSVVGTMAATLAAFVSSMTGGGGIGGTMSAVMGVFTSAISGTTAVVGSMAVTLGSFAASMFGDAGEPEQKTSWKRRAMRFFWWLKATR